MRADILLLIMNASQRWLIACSGAGAIAGATPCRPDAEWIGPITLALATALGQAVALNWTARRRLGWTFATVAGTIAAIVVGLIVGVSGALRSSALLRSDPGIAGIVLAVLLGGAAGGAVLGMFQFGVLPRRSIAWIGVSAAGGLVALPLSLWVLYGSAAGCPPTFMGIAIGAISGTAYWMLTCRLIAAQATSP